MNNHLQRKKQKGAVMLLFTLIYFFVVLPTVGLAVDGGVAYMVKAKLQAAADGAALSAARSLSRGLSLSAQQDSARATAIKFFNGNMSSGWMGTSNPNIEVTFPSAPPKTTIVQVRADVNAPTYFMRLLGRTIIPISIMAAANRRDVNVVLVLDRSGSLQNSGSCASLREAAQSFVQSFVDGRDRLGLLTFGTTYHVDFDLAYDFQSRGGGAGGDMVAMINSITCIGGTNAAAPYWQAYERFLANPEPGALNVILFFTDGQPNTLHMNALKIKAASTCVDKSDKNGVLTPAGSAIWGIFIPTETNPPPAPNPDWRVVPNSNGCAYNANFANVPNDLVSLAPAGAANEKDAWGNSLTGWKPVTRDGSDRIKVTKDNVTNAGINALDNAAQRIRAESAANGLEVITFCIGLGNASNPPERALLERIANVPESSIYDSTKPTGMLVYADSAAQLEAAFAQLASDILRLSM